LLLYDEEEEEEEEERGEEGRRKTFEQIDHGIFSLNFSISSQLPCTQFTLGSL
jgi:hypothetical protein